MSEFADALSTLVAAEVGKNDPKATGIVIERLLHSVAFTIAIQSRGDRKRLDEFVMAAEAYIAETALEFEQVSAFMAKGCRP